jgi:thioredoxin reductase
MNNTTPSGDELYTLAIVGAGLSALSALQAGLKSERTLLIESQDGPGGFLRSVLPTSDFAELAGLSEITPLLASLTTRLQNSVVGLRPALTPGEPHTLILRQGDTTTTSVRASRVLLACGGLELAGELASATEAQSAWIFSLSAASQLLQRGKMPGKQIVVHGSSRYALAVAQRLAAAGLSVTLVNIAGEPYPALPDIPSSLAFVPPARLVSLAGSSCLEQVTFERLGEQFSLDTDILVYTSEIQVDPGWIKESGIALNAQGEVRVDEHYQTSTPGIYAIGTLVAPSLDHVASLKMGRALAAYLSAQ